MGVAVMLLYKVLIITQVDLELASYVATYYNSNLDIGATVFLIRITIKLCS